MQERVQRLSTEAVEFDYDLPSTHEPAVDKDQQWNPKKMAKYIECLKHTSKGKKKQKKMQCKCYCPLQHEFLVQEIKNSKVREQYLLTKQKYLKMKMLKMEGNEQ